MAAARLAGVRWRYSAKPLRIPIVPLVIDTPRLPAMPGGAPFDPRWALRARIRSFRLEEVGFDPRRDGSFGPGRRECVWRGGGGARASTNDSSRARSRHSYGKDRFPNSGRSTSALRCARFASGSAAVSICVLRRPPYSQAGAQEVRNSCAVGSGANRLDGSLLSIFCMHKQHGRNFSGAGNRANSTACACLCASYRDRPQCDVFESLLSWPT